MRIVSNNKLIRRNQKVGQIITLVSLGVLVAGLVISFQPNLLMYSFIALLLGFVLSQVGIFYGARFGRSPRPDERITAALKGLDDKYTLYHYMTPAPHLLVGPAGVWVILPYAQKGKIIYDDRKNRWVQKGGNLYLKLFAQEGIGRPDLDLRTAEADLSVHFSKELGADNVPTIQAVMVFTHEQAILEAPNAPIPTVVPDKLKDIIRRAAKEKALAPEIVTQLQGALPQESIEAPEKK